MLVVLRVIHLPNQGLGCFRQGKLIQKQQLAVDQLTCSYTSLFVYKLPNSGVDLHLSNNIYSYMKAEL